MRTFLIDLLALENRYLNGIDVGEDGTLHVSWCYRDYVPVTEDGTRQHSGPNGPENVSFTYCHERLQVPIDSADSPTAESRRTVRLVSCRDRWFRSRNPMVRGSWEFSRHC